MKFTTFLLNFERFERFQLGGLEPLRMQAKRLMACWSVSVCGPIQACVCVRESTYASNTHTPPAPLPAPALDQQAILAAIQSLYVPHAHTGARAHSFLLWQFLIQPSRSLSLWNSQPVFTVRTDRKNTPLSLHLYKFLGDKKYIYISQFMSFVLVRFLSGDVVGGPFYN